MKKPDQLPSTTRWVTEGLCLGVAVVVLLALVSLAVMFMRDPKLWRDFRGIEDPDRVIPSLGGLNWDAPKPIAGPPNAVAGNVASGLADEGETLVFSRLSAESGDHDLYVTRNIDNKWTEPEPLLETNSDADEFSPYLSRDGRFLLFSSDRAGGYGGQDVYVAFRLDAGWGRAYNLGEKVNSEFDELDPRLSADERDLYFASNRVKAGATEAERRQHWTDTIKAQAQGDLDIYKVADLQLPGRGDPLRDPAFRRRLISQLGGSTKTEEAVIAALDWLVKIQEPDGWWDIDKVSGKGVFVDRTNGRKNKDGTPVVTSQDAAATAMAALCFYGWGEKHTMSGTYRKPLLAAMDWLCQEATRRNGDFTDGGHGMYKQAMVTLTLAEAYAATQDEMLLEPLAKCTKVIVDAQDPKLGGWRYTRTPAMGDTSVSGWQATAVKRAKAAGIEVPDKVFTGIDRWLDHAGGKKNQLGGYGYMGPGTTPTMTAVGMFMRQMQGARPVEPRQLASAKIVAKSQAKEESKADLYYWYYGFLAMYQQQGPEWESWNQTMREELLRRQIMAGEHRGTWLDDKFKGRMDRVTSTALATLSLEVYYRYLPMYTFEGVTMEAMKKSSQTMRVTHVVPPEVLVPLTSAHVPELSSPSTDRMISFTRHGDLVYFCSNRPGTLGGLDIFGATVTPEGFGPVEHLGESLNSARDDLSPTMTDNGHWMIFSSDRSATEGAAHLLYETRSIVVPTEVNRWAQFLAMLYRMRHWLMLMALTIIATCLLLVWYYRIGQYSTAGLKAKCYLASGMAHSLLLFLFSLWMIKNQVEKHGGDPRHDIVVEADSLATEKLALELKENLNTIESGAEPMQVQSTTPTMDLPDFTPDDSVPIPTMAESTFKIERPEFKVEVSHSQSSAKPVEPPTPAAAAKPAGVRAEISAIELETAPAREQVQTEAEQAPQVVPEFTAALDTLATSVKPAKGRAETAESAMAEAALPDSTDTAIPKVAVERPTAQSKGVGIQAPSAQLARATAKLTFRPNTPLDTNAGSGGEAEAERSPAVGPQLNANPDTMSASIRPGRGKAETAESTMAEADLAEGADTSLPKIAVERPEGQTVATRFEGPSDQLSPRMPRLEPALDTKLEAPNKTPSVYVFRDPSKRTKELVGLLGGSDATEAAVGRALDWFSGTQEEDGRWSSGNNEGAKGYDIGATGIAMLCYYGWGAKHNEKGRYQPQISKALKWLVAQVDENGKFKGNKTSEMYNHAIGTLALAEAYGLTKDEALKGPLEQVVKYVQKAQDKTSGGWRYTAGQKGGDTSVTGWQMMALISARMAGIEVDEKSIKLGQRWLKAVSCGPAAGHYGYNARKATPTMTAVSMFCQQLLQLPPHDPRMMASAAYIGKTMPNPKRRDYYYWYYGTLSLYQHQGPIWEEWNKKMKTIMLDSQVDGGDSHGSWAPDGTWTKNKGGRIFSTAFSTLSLEVYYRYLPMYNTSVGTVAKRKKGQKDLEREKRNSE